MTRLLYYLTHTKRATARVSSTTLLSYRPPAQNVFTSITLTPSPQLLPLLDLPPQTPPRRYTTGTASLKVTGASSVPPEGHSPPGPRQKERKSPYLHGLGTVTRVPGRKNHLVSVRPPSWRRRRVPDRHRVDPHLKVSVSSVRPGCNSSPDPTRKDPDLSNSVNGSRSCLVPFAGPVPNAPDRHVEPVQGTGEIRNKGTDILPESRTERLNDVLKLL